MVFFGTGRSTHDFGFGGVTVGVGGGVAFLDGGMFLGAVFGGHFE